MIWLRTASTSVSLSLVVVSFLLLLVVVVVVAIRWVISDRVVNNRSMSCCSFWSCSGVSGVAGGVRGRVSNPLITSREVWVGYWQTKTDRTELVERRDHVECH